MKKLFYTDVCRNSNDILFRGFKNGQRFEQKVRYKPKLYVNVNNESESKYRSLSGSKVEPLEFDTMYHAQDYIKEFSDVDGYPIHGLDNWVLQFIGDAFPKEVEFDRDLINVTTIDIEVQSDQGFPHPEQANHPITAITIKNNIDNIYYVWGLGDWSQDKSIVDNLSVKYVKCANESELLHSFLEHWQIHCPDIITGWNSKLFDMVYVVNRIAKVIGEEQTKRLSPWNGQMKNPISSRTVDTGFSKQQAYIIAGIQQIDYLELFKKFAYKYGNQESYKLDHIGHVVLGEKKIDYSEYGSLNELYIQDHQKFIDYNIKDVELVDRLEDKMGLISLCITIATKAKCNFTDAFGSVIIWDALIYNELMKKNIVCPPKRRNKKTSKIEGAFVKDPYVGMHDWVMSFDLNSLYPHIIMQYNMSPETVINDCHPFSENSVEYMLNEKPLTIPENCGVAGNGQFFDNTKKGLFPKMVENLYAERKTFKNEMLKVEQQIQDEGSSYELEKKVTTLHNQQMAIKILMNSLYGALSNEYFRYYDIRIAEGITLSGQLVIRWAEKYLNNFMNKVLKTEEKDYVIAIDTDSLYVHMGPLVDKVIQRDSPVSKYVSFLDQVAQQKIEPLLEKAYDDLRSYVNAHSQKMVMGREVIASNGVWTGKKRYVLNVYDNEGVRYKEPKLKMMGIEAVRSSTPQVCRDMFKDTLKIMLETDEKTTQQHIQRERDKFFACPVEDISFPRSVNKLEHYYDASAIYSKGTPIQVRGALLYNHFLKEKNLTNKYEKINSGEKVKFCYLKMPNTLKDNVIAYPTLLPDEFEIRDYVDYELQFGKAYLDPIKNILEAVGWEVEPKATLESFFG